MVSPNDFVIQVPFDPDPRWTILCLDVTQILEKSGLFPSSFDLAEVHVLKQWTLCSTMNVRGVYTSDNLYTWHTLPLEMRFKAPAGVNVQEWEQ